MRLLIVVFVFLAGCATISSVSEGMSRAEVIGLLGNPDGLVREGSDVALKYSNRLISGWSYDRADYYILLRNDEVIGYGPGNVRQSPNNTLVLLPSG